MYYKTEAEFKELPGFIKEIVAHLDLEKIQRARWFKNKSGLPVGLELFDYVHLETNSNSLILLALIYIISIDKTTGKRYKHLYYLPLLISKATLSDDELLLEIDHQDYNALVYDGVHTLMYNRALEKVFARESFRTARGGTLEAKLLENLEITCSYSLTDVSSNSLTVLSDNKIIKTYRRIYEGINPDLELSLALYEEAEFTNFPVPGGYISYKSSTGESYILSLLEDYIENKGDCWSYTLEFLKGFLATIPVNISSKKLKKMDIRPAEKGELNKSQARVLLEGFCLEMEELGQTIGRLHLALSRINKDSFLPVKPTSTILKRWYDRMKKKTDLLFRYLNAENNINRDLVKKIIEKEKIFYRYLEDILSLKDELGLMIRVHGDLHLEQVLRTGQKYLILDFEGEPLKDLEDRRLRQSPLKDLAGMVRSFNYASYFALYNFTSKYGESDDNQKRWPLRKDGGADRFYKEVLKIWEVESIESFLNGYLSSVRKERPDILPPVEKFQKGLNLFKLEKALYEAIYEINNRPDWIHIPLQGILSCLNDSEY